MFRAIVFPVKRPTTGWFILALILRFVSSSQVVGISNLGAYFLSVSSSVLLTNE